MYVCFEVPLAQTSFLWMTMHGHIDRTLAVEELLESEDITRMDWPAYFPDLNPIEHVWDALGRRIKARLHHPENNQQLKQMLIEEEGTPTARNVAPAGSVYAETVRSNHCSEGRACTILRNICLLVFLLNRPS
ncbi:transposable element Tc3 transposase [Trichonephila clavipes]|nr:transposable element Tc3 transposase [Trichonephila clavipes]